MKYLYRAIIADKEDKNDKNKQRTVYVVSEGLVKSAEILESKLSVDEEIREIIEISGEVYVK